MSLSTSYQKVPRYCIWFNIFTISILLNFLICWNCDYVQAHLLPEAENLHSKVLLDLSKEQRVQISIKTTLADASYRENSSLMVEYSMNSLEDLTRIKTLIPQFATQIMMTILCSGHQLNLKLKRTPLIITNNFIQKYFKSSGEPVVKHASDVESVRSYCYFTGSVIGHSGSIVSLSVCDGINGHIEIKDKVYSVKPVTTTKKFSHIWSSEKMDSSSDEDLDAKCNWNSTRELASEGKYHRRLSRQIRLPANHTPETRYIEIYVVMDKSIFEREGTVQATMTRAINIINFASTLYRKLGIYLALVGVEVWNEENKIPYIKAAGSEDYDSAKLLKNFNKYRRFKISWNVSNDIAQLFTAVNFQHRIQGRGLTDICSQTASAGINKDGISGYYTRAAAIMAHEMGHALKLPHTDTYTDEHCKCRDPVSGNITTCIMSAATAFRVSTIWSVCTKERLQETLSGYSDTCLRNKPEVLIDYQQSAKCGNFFTEPGEQCDCGPASACESKCCNPSNCQLYSNATCATGACCDLDTCTIRPISYPCRPIVDGECDLPEMCDGSSEWCPVNTYKIDGTECNNKEPGYCYNGQCNTHDSQCQKIWVEDSGDDIFYSWFNNYTTHRGNCGWGTTAEESDASEVQRKFHSCKTEEDKFCGLLQCKEPSPRRNVDIRNTLLKVDRNYLGGKWCLVAAFDTGKGVYDPGQVPNGAKCGDNKMCVDSECTTIPSLPDSCSCNGRGVCNQFKQCHCDTSWAPPDCLEAGSGGSMISTGMVTAPPPRTDSTMNGSGGNDDNKTGRLKTGVTIGLSLIGVLVIVVISLVIFCKRRNQHKTIATTDTSYANDDKAMREVPTSIPAPSSARTPSSSSAKTFSSSKASQPKTEKSSISNQSSHLESKKRSKTLKPRQQRKNQMPQEKV